MKDIDKVLEKWIYPVITFKDYFMTHEDRVKRMVEIDEKYETKNT